MWESPEALWEFTYRSPHLDVMRRRREWFDRLQDHHLVLWWTPAGSPPTLAEATRRLELLRRHGPTPEAFTFRERYDPPSSGGAEHQPVNHTERAAEAASAGR